MTVYSTNATSLALQNGDSISPLAMIGGTGLVAAVQVAANATVRIAGTVYGTQGVLVSTGTAVITVNSTGRVLGDVFGVNLYYGGTLYNYGSLEGGYYAVVFQSQGLTLANVGMISASSTAVCSTSSNGPLVLDNIGGTIIGSIGISGSGTSTTINNTGLIATFIEGGNAVVLDQGWLKLTNSGTIIGSVGGLVLGDSVTNDGLIQGNVNLGGGNDTYSGVGRVTGTVYGGSGNDTLTGGIYDDRLNGGTDDDIIDGGRGNDVMTGEGGNDTFYVDARGDRVIEAVGGGADTVYTTVSYALRAGQEIEALAVNPDADFADVAINLKGNEFANTLTGNAANNRLDGGGGADTMTGGDGDDVYYVDDAGDVVVETANHGSDTVLTSVSYALPAHIEILRALGSADIDLTGNDLTNTIVGNAGANRIDGGTGADRMVGNAGDDTYVVDNEFDTIVENAGGGVDTVEASISHALRGNVENLFLTGTAAIDGKGNSFANTIVGNGAANTIDGKGGFDMLTGGGGADTFVFSSKLDAAFNLATITDFAHGVDRIALDDAFFRQIGTAGSLGEACFAASAPTTRDHHILYDSVTGVLSYDLDGSGARPATAFAQVIPGTVLDHNDFLIV